MARASIWTDDTKPEPQACPAARSDLPLVRAVNCGLRSAWRRGLLTEPVLDPGWLTSEAARHEREEPSPGCWEQAMRCLISDLHRSARLNPLGQTIAQRLILRAIRQRIRAARLWRKQPAILDASVAAPVIILGQMRSGTTRLQRLLACDDQFAHTQLHQSLEPIPRSRAAAIFGAQAANTFLNLCNPTLRCIHPTSAFAPEEEFGLHAFSLHGAMFEAQWHIPSFARWSEERRDLTPVYREFRQLVQTLRWQRGDDRRVQLLKAPQFMQELPAVNAVFPDARIIRIHREPATVLASTASLVWHQQRIQSDHAEPAEVGAEWRRKTQMRHDRTAQALQSMRTISVLSVRYDAMNVDWRREIGAVYDFLGLPLRQSVVHRMSRVIGSRRHAGHDYDAARFGLVRAR